jgi:hypothetical protein
MERKIIITEEETEETDIFSETDICKKEEWLSMISAEIESYSINKRQYYSCNLQKNPLKIDGIYVYIYIYIIYEGTCTYYTYSFETANIILVNEAETRFRQVIVFESNQWFNDIRTLFSEMITVKDRYIFSDCRFIPPEEKHKPKISNFNSETCSVCFETTYYYTLCKHPLCYKCREKCIEYNNISCPICRQTNVMMFKEKKTMINAIYYMDDEMDIVDLDLDLDDELDL